MVSISNFFEKIIFHPLDLDPRPKKNFLILNLKLIPLDWKLFLDDEYVKIFGKIIFF